MATNDQDFVTAVEDVLILPENTGGDKPIGNDASGVSDEGALPEGAYGESKYYALGIPGGILSGEPSAVEDVVLYATDPTYDYSDAEQDADGAYFLGGTSIKSLLKIDASQGVFGTPLGNGHYGAGKDGQYYVDGVATAFGDFGTLADGLRTTAWRGPNLDPQSTGTTILSSHSLTADDVLHLEGTFTSWTVDALSISSAGRWYLSDDIDVQFDFDNWVLTSGTSGGVLFYLSNGLDSVQINRLADGTYTVARTVDGVWASLGNAATSHTSGKLRLTRTSGVFQAYYWNGSSWSALGSTYTHSSLSGSLYADIKFAGAGAIVSVDLSNFAVNAGTVSTKASWFREASGVDRGAQQSMPDSLLAVCTYDTLDLIDPDTDKLWMRFNKGPDLALHNVSPWRPRRCAWGDGVLMLAFGKETADNGSGIVIDFTEDTIRLHRNEASAVTGGYFGKGAHVEVIGRRNEALGLSGDYTNWHTPHGATFDVDVWHDGGDEFRAVATYEGISMFRWSPRWTGGADRDVDRSTSSETSHVRSCLIDKSDGELFYMDDANIYSCPQATWEGVMPTTQVFTSVVSKVVPGSHLNDDHLRFVKHGSDILVPAVEGVYAAAWPAGSFALRYGSPGSGATYEILPPHSAVMDIALSQDGGTNVLICGLDNSLNSVAVINLDTNTLYGVAPTDVGRAPVSVSG